jgi:hypothetical protein
LRGKRYYSSASAASTDTTTTASHKKNFNRSIGGWGKGTGGGKDVIPESTNIRNCPTFGLEYN